MRFQPHRPVSVPESGLIGCACGWVGSAKARESDLEPGFQQWLSDHWSPVLDGGHLRALVAREVLIDLESGWRQMQHTHWNSTKARQVLLGWGWWCAVNRSARAMLVLAFNSQAVETVPHLRSMFEHTMFLHALATQGEQAFDAAVREHWRHGKNIAESSAGGPLGVLSTAFAEAWEAGEPPAVAEAEGTQQVYGICKKLSAINTLYVRYRMWCNQVHPTIASASRYTKESGDDEAPELIRQPDFEEETDLIFWGACLLIWAGQAFRSFVELLPISDKIDEAASKLTVPTLATFSASTTFGAVNLTPKELDELLFGAGGGADQASSAGPGQGRLSGDLPG